MLILNKHKYFHIYFNINCNILIYDDEIKNVVLIIIIFKINFLKIVYEYILKKNYMIILLEIVNLFIKKYIIKCEILKNFVLIIEIIIFFGKKLVKMLIFKYQNILEILKC